MNWSIHLFDVIIYSKAIGLTYNILLVEKILLYLFDFSIPNACPHPPEL
jgi:hypothetical protein